MGVTTKAVVVLREGLAPGEKTLMAKFGAVGALGLVEIPAITVTVLDPVYLRVEYIAENGTHVVLDIPHLAVLAIRRERDRDSNMGFVHGPTVPEGQPQGDHGSSAT